MAGDRRDGTAHALPEMLPGASPAMAALRGSIARVAPTDATVLLVGESGTGKELAARSIHLQSARSSQPFIAVNCGAIPAELIEAAIFGHEKGSFTGALRQQAGYFEQACGGTLFLDEVTEMPAEMQVKLLRVLECGSFLRVGGDDEVKVDVRLLAATNRELDDAVRAGSLRPDLMYRLAVFPLRLPPLRARLGDAELLAQHFLAAHNARHGTRKHFVRGSGELLRSHPWPGNVRELKNLVLRAYILAGDAIDLAEFLKPARAGRAALREGSLSFVIGTALADAQREIILATLQHFGGNKRQTAEALGVSLKTLYNRLKEC